MNRAERRRTGKKGHEPVINIKTSDINQIKENAIMEASNKAFFLMLAIPVMVIHDKYPQLMRRDVEGKSRAERFADLCIDLYDSFDRGYITLEDFHQCLWEEAGIKIERS